MMQVTSYFCETSGKILFPPNYLMASQNKSELKHDLDRLSPHCRVAQWGRKTYLDLEAASSDWGYRPSRGQGRLSWAWLWTSAYEGSPWQNWIPRLGNDGQERTWLIVGELSVRREVLLLRDTSSDGGRAGAKEMRRIDSKEEEDRWSRMKSVNQAKVWESCS